MKKLLAILCLFFTATIAFADLSVTGEGKVSAEPDVAVVSVGVITENLKADQALAENAKIASVLIEKMNLDFAIDKKNICTSNFSLNVKYKYHKDEEPKFAGYVVTNVLTVRYSKLDQVGHLLDVLVKNGANSVQGVDFQVSNTSVLLDEARKKAVQDATRKATLYAKELNLTLDKAVTISESGSYVPRYTRAESMSRASGDSFVAAGERELRVNVNVVFSFKK